MKRTQWRSLAAIGVLWLALGAGCQKDPPQPQSCDNGTCCMQDTRQYDYVETIENQPADLGGPPFFAKWGLALKNGIPTKSQFQARGVQVCDLSLTKVINLKQTAPPPPDTSSGPYHYRVWGKVYTDHSIPLVPPSYMYIYIDRIEEVN